MIPPTFRLRNPLISPYGALILALAFAAILSYKLGHKEIALLFLSLELVTWWVDGWTTPPASANKPGGDA